MAKIILKNSAHDSHSFRELPRSGRRTYSQCACGAEAVLSSKLTLIATQEKAALPCRLTRVNDAI